MLNLGVKTGTGNDFVSGVSGGFKVGVSVSVILILILKPCLGVGVKPGVM
jgi:hypothetical protein